MTTAENVLQMLHSRLECCQGSKRLVRRGRGCVIAGSSARGRGTRCWTRRVVIVRRWCRRVVVARHRFWTGGVRFPSIVRHDIHLGYHWFFVLHCAYAPSHTRQNIVDSKSKGPNSHSIADPPKVEEQPTANLTFCKISNVFHLICLMLELKS